MNNNLLDMPLIKHYSAETAKQPTINTSKQQNMLTK